MLQLLNKPLKHFNRAVKIGFFCKKLADCRVQHKEKNFALTKWSIKSKFDWQLEI